jgi:hypothetical protein
VPFIRPGRNVAGLIRDPHEAFVIMESLNLDIRKSLDKVLA